MRNSDVTLVALLLTLTMMRGIIYAAVTPPWQAPEEPWHLELVRLYYEYGRPVSNDDPPSTLYSQILASMHTFHFWEFVPSAEPNPQHGERYQRPLYYRLATTVLALTAEGSVLEQLFLVRLWSVVLGILAVALAYLTTRLLFPEDLFLRIGVPAFISFLPTHTFSISTVNNDPMVEVAVTLSILFLVLMLKKGLSVFTFAGLVLSLILGYYSKRTFVVAIPLALVGVVVAFCLYLPKGRRSRLLIVGGLLVAFVAGLWLWGTGLPGQWVYRLFARFDYGGGPRDIGAMLRLLSRVYPQYARGLFESFWGMFGWGTAKLTPLWFGFLALVSLAAAVGLIRLTLKRPRQFVPWQHAALGVCLLAVCLSVSLVVVTTLDIYRWGKGYTEALPQARYIFPTIVPIATLFTLGLRAWIPTGRDRLALLAYVLALVGFDALSMVGYILPSFYGRVT